MKRLTNVQARIVERVIEERLAEMPGHTAQIRVVVARTWSPDRVLIQAEICPVEWRGLVRHVVETSVPWSTVSASSSVYDLTSHWHLAARELHAEYRALTDEQMPELGQPRIDDQPDPLTQMLGRPQPAQSWLDRLIGDYDLLAEVTP